jgi:predicted O-methyltransferase YrrM
MFNSKLYWEQRYKNNNNSGCGSYNNLARFKADVINDFIAKNNIVSIIDYGVGDGNQLKLINTQDKIYTGIDVSPTVINKCRTIFANDTTKTFLLDTEIQNIKADLTLSCDVVYHLVEDHVYHEYMNNLFGMSNKYVIIYAKNEDIKHAQHVRFRKFTNYINQHLKDWKLIKHIPNRYPQVVLGRNNDTTSPSDFYIFENFQTQTEICQNWENYIETKLLPIIKVDLEGNIYSKHNSKSKYSNLEPKRYNIINLMKTLEPKNVLEIGFNAGFSSLLMKMSSHDFELTCVDINFHEYVVPCFEQISKDYQGMDIILKPSADALTSLIQENKKYDLIHIDGDHSLEGAKKDLELCLRLSHENTIIIFDDTNIKHLSDLCDSFVRNGKIVEYTMPNFIQCREYKHTFYKIFKEEPVYVSLTSIFKNQKMLLETLKNMVRQSRKPDKIFLFLSEGPFLLDSGFPNREMTDENLKRFLEENIDFIQVNWVENQGSYRKLLPLLKEKWDEDCIIITIDDDTVYDDNLIGNMIRDYRTHRCAVNYRGFTPKMANFSSFDYLKRGVLVKKHHYNFPTGKGGVLYKPQFFHKTGDLIFNKNIYLNACGAQDDIWFYIIRVKNNVACYLDNKPYMKKDFHNNGLYSQINRHNNKNTLVFRQVLQKLTQNRL